MTPELTSLYNHAKKNLLIPNEERREKKRTLNRSQIASLLPHRDPMLLLDRVSACDLHDHWLIACYAIAQQKEMLRGHFPGHPVYPGVFQVEAIGQAGVLLYALKQEVTLNNVRLTNILAARFMHPILPTSSVEIVVKNFEEGWEVITIGQCIQEKRICSIAAVIGLGE